MEKKIVPTSRLCHKGVGSISGKCSIPDMLAELGKLGRRHKGSRRRQQTGGHLSWLRRLPSQTPFRHLDQTLRIA